MLFIITYTNNRNQNHLVCLVNIQIKHHSRPSESEFPGMHFQEVSPGDSESIQAWESLTLQRTPHPNDI